MSETIGRPPQGDGDPNVLTDEQLLAELVAFEVETRARVARQHALVAEAHARGLAGGCGHRSTGVLLAQLLRLDEAEARARVAAAVDLGPRRAVTGEPLAPVFPHVAAAQADGASSAAHARVVIRAVEKLPPALRAEHEDAVEQRLVAAARQFAPREVHLLGERILAHVNPDGVLDDGEERRRRRGLGYRRRPDGSCVGRFDTDTELGELLDTAVTALSAPKPAPDGTPDPRNRAQRQHDALRDLLYAALRAQTLPSQAGLPISVLLIGTPAEYAAGTGTMTTGTGAVLSTAEVKKWTGGSDTRMLAVLLDDAGRAVSYSSCQRLFTEQQRLVLVARDKGCSFPGCTAGPWLCQAHHIRDWAKGGPTAVTNGTLLCRYHHREFELLGWSCQYLDGRAAWTAPEWLDPTRTPVVNTAHDPPDG